LHYCASIWTTYFWTTSVNLTTSALLGLLISTQYALWVGDKNVPDLYHLKEAVNETREENQGLHLRNQKLLAEVIDLKQGGETIETLARSELGLIKPEETFYQIIQQPRSSQKSGIWKSRSATSGQEH